MSGWTLAGTPYVGSVLPPVGPVGREILVDNAAVPSGCSKLRSNGTIWAPPAGELIAAVWRGASPVALVTPGVTTLTVVYSSPVIPDYMLPANQKGRLTGNICAFNAAGVPNCMVALCISGSVPTTGYAFSYNYPLAQNVTPNSGGMGVAAISFCEVILNNARANFMHPTSGGPLERNSGGNFVSGANKIYAMAQPSSVTDQIQFDGASFVSEGNL